VELSARPLTLLDLGRCLKIDIADALAVLVLALEPSSVEATGRSPAASNVRLFASSGPLSGAGAHFAVLRRAKFVFRDLW
jgi:hypothetical protein